MYGWCKSNSVNSKFSNVGQDHSQCRSFFTVDKITFKHKVFNDTLGVLNATERKDVGKLQAQNEHGDALRKLEREAFTIVMQKRADEGNSFKITFEDSLLEES